MSIPLWRIVWGRVDDNLSFILLLAVMLCYDGALKFDLPRVTTNFHQTTTTTTTTQQLGDQKKVTVVTVLVVVVIHVNELGTI